MNAYYCDQCGTTWHSRHDLHDYLRRHHSQCISRTPAQRRAWLRRTHARSRRSHAVTVVFDLDHPGLQHHTASIRLS